MHVERGCKLTRFSQVDPGRVLIANFKYERVVYGMKAFVLGEDRDRDEIFVTLGPFVSDEINVPAAYDPDIIYDRPVLDISDECRFVPSLDPQDILPEIHRHRDYIGCVFLLEDQTLLGIQWHTTRPIWRIAYLNLKSGELSIQMDHNRFHLSRKWSLRRFADDRETSSLFEFSAKSVAPKATADK